MNSRVAYIVLLLLICSCDGVPIDSDPAQVDGGGYDGQSGNADILRETACDAIGGPPRPSHIFIGEIMELPIESAIVRGYGSPSIEVRGSELRLPSAGDSAYLTVPAVNGDIVNGIRIRYKGSIDPCFSVKLIESRDGELFDVSAYADRSTEFSWIALGFEHAIDNDESRLILEMKSDSGSIAIFDAEYSIMKSAFLTGTRP